LEDKAASQTDEICGQRRCSAKSVTPQAAIILSRATTLMQGKEANAGSKIKLAIIAASAQELWAKHKIIKCSD
jgi:hypothetical protein